MEKINKKNWIVSGLLVLAFVFGLFTFLGVKAPEQKVYASSISASDVYYYDDIEYREKTFAEELPAGYTFSNGVLTVGSASTHDYQIWTDGDGDGDLTIVFERDYGGDANYNSVNYNDLFIEFTANSGKLTLTSTSNVNVTLAGLGSNYQLYLLGKVNLNVIGPDYAGSMIGRYGSCLVYCGETMYVEGNASFTAKDPNLHERTKTNSEYAIVKLGCLVLNTTGCFKAGLYETSTTTDVAYALNILDGGYISYSKCDDGFVLYANSSSMFIDAYDYYVGDEYLTIEENDEGKRELTIRECIISFNANGGSSEMENELKTKGNYTLPSCTFTPPSGKQFLCWAKNSTTGTQYNSGTQYYVSCNVTFYAIWEDIPAVELTGTVAINGNLKYGETLTAVLSGDNNTGTLSYEWRRNGETISGATNSTYTLTQDDIGYTMSVVVRSSVESGSLVGTAASTIDKADGPNAPTGITSTGCTTNANNDGTLVGITAEMEYKLSSSEDWTAGTGATITNLANGTYNVRYKATATHNAGASANVVVNAYNAPILYGITVVDGSANVLSTEAGTTITITADEAPSGYVFDKWTSADGVVFTDENNATTTFNMPSKNVTITATYKPITVESVYPDPVVEPKPENNGLSAGAVVGIILASLAVLGGAGFCVYYFVIRKKKIAK